MTDHIDHIPLAQAFADELHKLIERMDWPNYKTISLTLTVVASKDEAKAIICFSAGYNEVTVNGATLGVVMDEAYHRLGYDDREKAHIQTSLKRLAPPTEEQLTPATKN